MIQIAATTLCLTCKLSMVIHVAINLIIYVYMYLGTCTLYSRVSDSVQQTYIET